MREPVYPGYLADPFLTSTASGYLIYGTGDPGRSGSRTFETIVSDDAPGERRRATFDALAERARTLNGRFSVDAPEEGGTTVHVVLPPYADG